MDESRIEGRREDRETGIISGGGTGDDDRGSDRSVPSATKSHHSSASFDDIAQGVTIQKLPPRCPVKDIAWLHYDLTRGALLGMDRKDAKDSRGITVAGMFKGPVWRACLGASHYWTYGDSKEAVEIGALQHYRQTYDPENNNQRWPEYQLCVEMGQHMPDPATISGREQNKHPKPRLCTKCGTEYHEYRGRFAEINPPYDPVLDQPPVPTLRLFTLHKDWNVVEEKHIVSWAVWFSYNSRIAKKTDLEQLAVITQFRGYSDHDPPLLWDTYLSVGNKAFPVGLHETRLEAIVCHDQTVGEILEKHCS